MKKTHVSILFIIIIIIVTMSLFTRFIIFREGIDPELVETCKKFNASLIELELDDETGAAGGTGTAAGSAAAAAAAAERDETSKSLSKQVALVGTDSTYSYSRFIKSPTDLRPSNIRGSQPQKS